MGCTSSAAGLQAFVVNPALKFIQLPVYVLSTVQNLSRCCCSSSSYQGIQRPVWMDYRAVVHPVTGTFCALHILFSECSGYPRRNSVERMQPSAFMMIVLCRNLIPVPRLRCQYPSCFHSSRVRQSATLCHHPILLSILTLFSHGHIHR